MDYPVLAIDFGQKRIGLAISDYSGKVASPIQPIRITKSFSEESLLEQFNTVINENNIKGLVIGIPQEFKEEHKINTQRILKFIEWLSHNTKLPYKTWDESFSTSTAKDMIVSAGSNFKKRKKQVDSIAAAVFLQEFLNYENKNDEIN